MQRFDSSFIGSFKLGDNINYNLSVLKRLYEYYESSSRDKKHLLHKPIIIMISSIIEAILYDFYKRAKLHTREGIANIKIEILTHIRSEKGLSKFGRYIETAKRHDLFSDMGSNFYKDLTELSKIRNRVHIQNDKKEFEPDDQQAFNSTRKRLAERTLESVMRIMAERHSRGEGIRGHVADFHLPWPAAE